MGLLATFKGILAWSTVLPDAEGWDVCQAKLGDGLDYYRGQDWEVFSLLRVGAVCGDTLFRWAVCYLTLFAVSLVRFPCRVPGARVAAGLFPFLPVLFLLTLYSPSRIDTTILLISSLGYSLHSWSLVIPLSLSPQSCGRNFQVRMGPCCQITASRSKISRIRASSMPFHRGCVTCTRHHVELSSDFLAARDLLKLTHHP